MRGKEGGAHRGASWLHEALFGQTSATNIAEPAGDVTVVSYLWPVLVIALQSAFAIARPSRLQWIGVGLGFGGVLVFAWPALSYGSGSAIDGSMVFGLALAAATSFATYTALRPRVSGGTVDAVGTACGVAAVIAAGLHFGSGGEMVDLDAASLTAMILLGAGPMGLANLMCDHGVRHGDGRLLSACAYLTPILSTSLLVLLGLATPTIGLTVGGLLIVAGVCLGACMAQPRSPVITPRGAKGLRSAAIALGLASVAIKDAAGEQGSARRHQRQ